MRIADAVAKSRIFAKNVRFWGRDAKGALFPQGAAGVVEGLAGAEAGGDGEVFLACRSPLRSKAGFPAKDA